MTVTDKSLLETRTPSSKARPAKRCNQGLAAGAITASGGVLWELVECFGAARLRVRMKTATNGGALDIVFVGPDFPHNPPTATAYASLPATKYSTGNPTQVPVTAGTEAKIDVDCYGEQRALIKFTGSGGAGTVTYCDVSQV